MTGKISHSAFPNDGRAMEADNGFEDIEYFDEDDQPIGIQKRNYVIRSGLIHRSANVIIRNDMGQIFVHQRKKTKAIYGGMWDIKVGGIPMVGESYNDAARRELLEETGIRLVELKFLFDMKFRDNLNKSNRKVFCCRYNGPIRIQQEEIEQGWFMPIEKAVEMGKEGKLSPSAVSVLAKYMGEGYAKTY